MEFSFKDFFIDMGTDLVGMEDTVVQVKTAAEVSEEEYVMKATEYKDATGNVYAVQKKVKAHAIINRLLLIGGGILIGLFAIGPAVYNPEKNKKFKKKLEKLGYTKPVESQVPPEDNQSNQADY